MTDPVAYHCSYAWLPDAGAGLRLAADVRIEVTDGRIASIAPIAEAEPDSSAEPAVLLAGVVTAGFANSHSHAFHRALRGRTHDGGGSFWTWRERMYALADRLDPDAYLALATATFAEMALAGVTCVGEFHYLHHGPGGHPYDDPNTMGEVVREAARRAGIRVTLLDACYLTGGIGVPLSPSQQRFADTSVDAWAARVSDLTPDGTTRIGVAVHSVRAVPPAAIGVVAGVAEGPRMPPGSTDRGADRATDTRATDTRAADTRATGPLPLHAHVSEQPAENDACHAAYGMSPTRLLQESGALTAMTTAVHATHLSADDIAILGGARAFACVCPTTERDLADGIGPARALLDAGARLTLGSDQHAMIDLLEEARGLEMDERLATLQRGRFPPSDLLTALTVDGHASLGWPEAGRLAVGAPADLVCVRLDTARTAGADPAQALLVASAGDVDTVVVGGRVVVSAGQHVLGDIGPLLAAAIEPLWRDAPR